MRRFQQASPFSPTSCSAASRGPMGLCLAAILVSACSVDLTKLRLAGPPGSDGSADLPQVADAMGTGTEGDADVDTGPDAPLGPWDSPAEDGSVPYDSVKVPPDAKATLDATGPDVATDTSDLAEAVDVTLDPPADSAVSGGGGISGSGGNSSGSGGSGGTGDVDACDTGAGGGGSGGTGGFHADAEDDRNSGSAGDLDAESSGGPGGAIDTSSGEAGGAGGSSGGNTGTGGLSGSGGAGGDPDLVLWYKFDEASGTLVADSSQAGGNAHDGTVGTAGTGGSATFTTDCQVGTHALSLVNTSRGSTPAGGYVTIPAPEALAPGALTIALWIKLAAATSSENWERIFDFGNGSTANAYLYLTARASDATTIPLRFGISNTGHTTAAEQRLESPNALTANVWHHIAIVLPTGAPYTGSLYLDGLPVATNKAMTLHMSDVGATTLNWLGRSPFSADPLFNGSLDDFRIYKRALSATELSALYTLR